jgi:AAA15 family ATPase/GTPase
LSIKFGMGKTYITRAILKDYLTIKNVDITFTEGINIIIGKNGTGKTNFINYLADSLLYRPQKKHNQSIIYFSHNYKTFRKETNVSTVLDSNLIVSNIEEINVFEGAKKVTGYLQRSLIFPSLIKHGLPKHYLLADEPITDFIKVHDNQTYSIFPETDFVESVTGLSLALYSIERKNDISISNLKGYIEPLIENLKSYTNIKDVRFGINSKLSINDDDEIHFNNFYFEYFVNNEWLLFNQLSDGTKRLFYIISEITLSNHSVILLEEPELGIHPHQLYDLMRFIKEMSEEKQFIITTHSPMVLDTLDKAELGNIIISKIENGETKLEHLTDAQVEKAKMYMEKVDLSDYWVHSDLED